MTFIDWDGAGPGSGDLAYAAHGFVPLSAGSGLGDEAAAERLLALVDGYELDAATRSDFIEMIGPRIRSMCNFLKQSHESGIKPWSRLWLEGHGHLWLEVSLYAEERNSE